MLWTRNSLPASYFQLPSGFRKHSPLLTSEMAEILEDIQALHCVREAPQYAKGCLELMASINNQTASIQSRLMDLPCLSPVMRCCRLAAYICSVMLCCTVWCTLVIPVSEPLTLNPPFLETF